MRRRQFLVASAHLALAAAVTPALAAPVAAAAPPPPTPPPPPLVGRLVAVGIPGAAAVSPVGTFLPGGPFHDIPAFAAATRPGQILDPQRLLVTSDANFGAPLARADQAPGAILSLDPTGAVPLVIPPAFASAGGQAAALGGAVRLFTAQTPAFVNGLNTPSAATADFTGVSHPLGLSLNNAFGRIWPANAPTGLTGPGSSTILDPSGLPLANAPDQVAGGVFAGTLTARQPQQLAGSLAAGAVGTALLGASPDGSGKAVFAVVTADGAVVQEQTLQGLDGLAPADTISPLRDVTPGTARAAQGTAATNKTAKRQAAKDQAAGTAGARGELRVGVALNPPDPTLPLAQQTRTLYLTDPVANAVVALTLTNNGVVFVPVPGSLRRITSDAFDMPIDLAPAMSDSTSAGWASNTTICMGEDLYVANRGNSTIARLRQDGTVVAVRQVALPIELPPGSWHLNGIGVSPDGGTIYATVAGMLPGGGGEGAVLALPAFGGR